MIDWDVVTHEAAHIVVGVQLGLKLREAVVGKPGDYAGYAWFPHARGHEWQLTLAAGIAWERAIHAPPDGFGFSWGDYKLLRERCYRRDIEALATAAAAMLRGCQRAHRLTCEALLDGRITQADIDRLIIS